MRMDYIGEKCPVCGELFTADDDIVVCPECGTPHHRECYRIENRCANEEMHSSGKKWEKKKEKEKTTGLVICPVCRFPNIDTDTSCQRCGAELGDGGARYDDDGADGDNWRDVFSEREGEELLDPFKYLGYDPDEDMGGVTLREISDFVGTNKLYYIPRFKRMKDAGAKPSFNVASLIFPSLFFANRKMWVWAIIAALLGIIFDLPANLLFYMEELPAEMADFIANHKRTFESVSNIFVIAELGMRAVFCFFANWLYYRFSMNALKRLKAKAAGSEGIRAVGGIKPMNMVLITILKYFIGLAVIMAVYFFCGIGSAAQNTLSQFIG